MQNTFLGVLIAICGNSLIGSSFAVMKVAHMRNTGEGGVQGEHAAAGVRVAAGLALVARARARGGRGVAAGRALVARAGKRCRRAGGHPRPRALPSLLRIEYAARLTQTAVARRWRQLLEDSNVVDGDTAHDPRRTGERPCEDAAPPLKRVG